MRPRDLACVILASGLSERFGESDKLQSLLCGRPVLDYVLDTALALGFAEIYLVSQDAYFPGITSVKNDNPEKGQGHALRLGLAAMRAGGYENICILLGDMPLVEVSHIKSLIEQLTETHSVISTLGEQRMPPAAFERNAISKILAEDSTLGAKSVFKSLDLLTLPLTKVQALDVDTPEDLIRIEFEMRARTK